MRKIAHIVNPFNAPESSDLYFAQPITFESMRVAKKKVEGKIEIELLYTCFAEDSVIKPIGFDSTACLTRSVLDCGDFQKKIKLPLIHDILERLYNASDAEYLIYTNVDIGLYENFYEKVNEFIDAGHDAFIINRRRISEKYTRVDQLSEIYKEKGKKHPGFDCFVFHRSLFPKLRLEGVCIGVPFIEITFSQNLFALANKFKLYDKEILTFHIGMEIFKKRASKEYFRYNQEKFWKSMKSDIRLKQSIQKIPYSNLGIPLRLIFWGIHPCFPIRLMLILEVKNIGRLFQRKKIDKK